MKILFVIAHFFQSISNAAQHGSQRKNPQERLEALTQCIYSLHQIFSSSQGIFDLVNKKVNYVNQSQVYEIDVLICTTGTYHLVEDLTVPSDLWLHHATQCDPITLSFECQALMRDCLGMYDYYCFLEDDTIIHDPWFFTKLAWFNEKFGDYKLLQPNRYQVSTNKLIFKGYPDGHLPVELTAKFQDLNTEPKLEESVLSQKVIFYRPSNPNAGSYFLNARQMQFWTEQSHFLEFDHSFFGPIESAAYLGIIRTFQIYKPAEANASFLEVEHFGDSYLSFLGSI